MWKLGCVLMLMLPLFVRAQNVSGIVQGKDGLAIEFAKIKLLNTSDSSVVAGAYSNDQGIFVIENTQSGSFILDVYFSGFVHLKKNITVASTDLNLGIVYLEIDKVVELDGVTAVGSLDVLKAGIDKKIYTTEDDISTRGGTVQDVLKNIPSVEVDQDGNISLRGDGNVVILINGRPSALAMGDGQNLLSALPANSVERIEVVTNPSAKYDPDGTSGIINIVLKKNKMKGFNGLVSATAATGELYQANTALSYSNQGFNVYMNYSFDYYEGYRNFGSELIRDITADSSIHLVQERGGSDLSAGHALVLGTEYAFNDRTVASFSLTGSLGRRDREGDLINQFYSNDLLTDTWSRTSYDPSNDRNLDVNVNFTRKLKEERGEWSFNANHSIGSEFIQGFYDESYLLENGISSGKGNLVQQLENNESTTNSTAQTDFSYIFPKIKARSEFGLKSIVTNCSVETFSETMDSITLLFEEDTLANFDYAFEQQVHSVYGIFGQELGKFKYQGGLRGEYAIQAPNLISSNQKFRSTYLNLFPSAHIKYAFNKEMELSLSYSKRINRPRGGQLNPFTSYADPFNLRTGNPFLEPEYIDSYDLGFSVAKKKFILTTSVFHRRTTDVINRVRVFYDDNTSAVTYGNVDKSVSTGLEVIAILKPTTWFKSTLSGNANYMQYIDADTSTNWNNSGVVWNLKYMGTIDFWRKTASAQLNLQYNPRTISPQGIHQRRAGVDFSIEKTFMSKKLSMVLKVTDIFDKKGFNMEYDRDGIVQTSNFKWLTRRFYVTLTYKFGKMDVKFKGPAGGGGGGGME